MPRGGARPNTGPKPGSKHVSTLEKEAMRQVIYDFVKDHMTDILSAMLKRAMGMEILHVTETGKQVAKQLPPDPEAARILIEHAIGKAPQSVALEGTDGNPPVFQIVNYGSNHDSA